MELALIPCSCGRLSKWRDELVSSHYLNGGIPCRSEFMPGGVFPQIAMSSRAQSRDLFPRPRDGTGHASKRNPSTSLRMTTRGVLSFFGNNLIPARVQQKNARNFFRAFFANCRAFTPRPVIPRLPGAVSYSAHGAAWTEQCFAADEYAHG